MTKLSGKPLIALLVIQALMLPVAGAESADRPVAVPDLDLPPGYDWASRENATHLIADATPLYSFVQAHDVKTPYLDLEIKGLMPWRGYELSLGTIRREVYTDGAGHGIAWNVFAENGMWTLTDHISGEPVTFLTIDATPEPNQGIPMSARVACSWNCPSRYTPPTPTSNATASGFVIEQGVYSFTKGVAIRSSSCYEHVITIDAKASGGLAATKQTAGGKYTYKTNECNTLSAGPGESMEFSRKSVARKDRYEDGSQKVYSIGPTSTIRTEIVNKVWEPGAGAMTVEVGLISRPQEVLRLREDGAGSVYYEHGFSVFGTDIGVSLKAETSKIDSSWIAFEVQPPGMKTYIVDWINGDYGFGARHGIIGGAWEASS